MHTYLEGYHNICVNNMLIPLVTLFGFFFISHPVVMTFPHESSRPFQKGLPILNVQLAMCHTHANSQPPSS